MKAGTWSHHESNVRLHIKPAIGRVKLSQLTALRVQRFYLDKQSSGISPACLTWIHTTLSKALKQAVQFRLIPFNPCEPVNKPRPIKAEVEVLDLQGLRRLFKAAEGTKLYALWVLLGTTGLRIGEALSLRWSDVDISGRVLRVNRTLGSDYPKTASSRRTVRLSRFACRALHAHPKCNSELVFSTRTGKAIAPNNLRRDQWSRLLRKAELLPGLHIHTLRHSAATLLISKGVPIKIVSEMLGHSSVAITLSIYAHVLPDMQDMAAAAIDNVLGE